MKISKRQLRKTIRRVIKEAWSSMPTWEQDLEDRAEVLGLERSDALLGAALELESRDAELKYLGRDPKSGTDVYLRNDNTYTTVAYGEQKDYQDEETMLWTIDTL